MKLLTLLLGFAALPSSLAAQGLPIDFDVDAVVAEQARRDAAAASAAKDDSAAARAVRLGERRPLQTDDVPAPGPLTPPAQPEG
ncbi:MAG: hypothetical protein ACOY5R_15990 [Pseudomonadota bacterium]